MPEYKARCEDAKDELLRQLLFPICAADIAIITRQHYHFTTSSRHYAFTIFAFHAAFLRRFTIRLFFVEHYGSRHFSLSSRHLRHFTLKRSAAMRRAITRAMMRRLMQRYARAAITLPLLMR